MCDFLSGGADTAGLLAKQQQAASEALEAQKSALAQQQAAAAGESEQTRLANESRMRKMLAAGPFGAAPTDYGTAPVATRQLYGEA